MITQICGKEQSLQSAMIQVHISVLTFHSPAYFLDATFGMQVAKWNIAFRKLDLTISRIKEVKGSSRAPKNSNKIIVWSIVSAD